MITGPKYSQVPTYKQVSQLSQGSDAHNIVSLSSTFSDLPGTGHYPIFKSDTTPTYT